MLYDWLTIAVNWSGTSTNSFRVSSTSSRALIKSPTLKPKPIGTLNEASLPGILVYFHIYLYRPKLANRISKTRSSWQLRYSHCIIHNNKHQGHAYYFRSGKWRIGLATKHKLLSGFPYLCLPKLVNRISLQTNTPSNWPLRWFNL